MCYNLHFLGLGVKGKCNKNERDHGERLISNPSSKKKHCQPKIKLKHNLLKKRKEIGNKSFRREQGQNNKQKMP